MRHDHAGRGARRGVRPEEDVAVAERHDPQRTRRHGLPRADHLQERAAPGPRLDGSDRDRPPRLRRSVSRDGVRDSECRDADDEVHSGRRRRLARGASLPFPQFRRRALDVQSRRFDPRLRARLLQLRPDAQLARLSLDEEHDPQDLRRPLQGHLPGSVRRGVPLALRGGGDRLRTSADRRHGRVR